MPLASFASVWQLATVAKVTTGLRLDPDMLADLDALALLMMERSGGASVSQHEAARVALKRGIVVLRAELTGHATTEKKKPARKPAK